MKVHYVTYATHSFGLFEELKNNKFKVPIKVLGWNTKWINFMDKIKGIEKYTHELKDDDILVFLDGFDTIINKDPKNIKQLFLAFKSKIVVSKEHAPFGDYIPRRVFGTCNGDRTANSGMYMGYVSSIRQMCNMILKLDTIDDQHGLNAVCANMDVKIDMENVLFTNTIDKNKVCDSLFISYPGGFAFNMRDKLKRYKRSIVEYSPYLKREILFIILLCIAIYYRKELTSRIKSILQK